MTTNPPMPVEICAQSTCKVCLISVYAMSAEESEGAAVICKDRGHFLHATGSNYAKAGLPLTRTEEK